SGWIQKRHREFVALRDPELAIVAVDLQVSCRRARGGTAVPEERRRPVAREEDRAAFDSTSGSFGEQLRDRVDMATRDLVGKRVRRWDDRRDRWLDRRTPPRRVVAATRRRGIEGEEQQHAAGHEQRRHPEQQERRAS